MTLPTGKHIRVEAPKSTNSLATFLRDADRAIEKISKRQLHPREVEALLSITSRERIRWTKEGRLPTSGRGSFRKGQLIQFPTYPIRVILALAENRAQTEDWRSNVKPCDQSGET